MELSEHLESMNHEISDCFEVIGYEGYRVDGDNGIKNAVNLTSRKSVDYYCIISSKCNFIEFSDLARGQEDLLGIEASIDRVFPPMQRNKLRKLVKQDARRDLVEKFKDSKDIFTKISDTYNEVPSEFLDESAKVFYIVHAPINDNLTDSEKSEIARFLITLEATVSSTLEDDICERVKLVLLNKFINKLAE
jgi:hypothetical protein